MEAKLCLSCTLCHAAIQPGMRIWPTGGGDGSGGRFLWVHLSCAADAGIDTARPPPCKHYARGACVMADRCFFAHDQDARMEVSPASLTPSPSGSNASEQPPRYDRHGEIIRVIHNRGPSRRNRVHNQHKAEIFRHFVITTFGIGSLKQGSGVVDVAGGQGELSFQLSQLNGIDTTVVDPRALKLTDFEKRLAKKFYNRSAFTRLHEELQDGDTTAGQLRHLRVLFELPRPPKPAKDEEAEAAAAAVEAWKPWPKALASVDTFVKALENDRRLVWDAQGLHRGASEQKEEEEEERAGEGGVEDHDDDHDSGEMENDGDNHQQQQQQQPTPVHAVTDLEEANRLLRTCSVLLGMHPDQGAEPLIDFALAHNKPFAVVPCCVYASRASWRVLEGKPVRSYTQFVNYLQAKDPAIQRMELDFGGRNICLYKLA